MGTNYYAEIKPACSHCGAGPVELHIGKSSAGWPFHFRRYLTERGDPAQLDSWTAWKAFLADKPIRDEYGAVVTLEELERKIVSKRIHCGSERHRDAIRQWPNLYIPDAAGDTFSDQEFS